MPRYPASVWLHWPQTRPSPPPPWVVAEREVGLPTHPPPHSSTDIVDSTLMRLEQCYLSMHSLYGYFTGVRLLGCCPTSLRGWYCHPVRGGTGRQCAAIPIGGKLRIQMRFPGDCFCGGGETPPPPSSTLQNWGFRYRIKLRVNAGQNHAVVGWCTSPSIECLRLVDMILLVHVNARLRIPPIAVDNIQERQLIRLWNGKFTFISLCDDSLYFPGI